MDFLTITWGFEKGIDLGFFFIRWYSLLFAAGFIVGFRIALTYFKQEGIPEKMLDKMLVYSVVATVVGARLGHVFFYDWDQYKNNLLDIFKVWEGGLASHGAAIALIIAMYLFGKKLAPYFDGVSVYRRSLWALDRLVITVALAGCFIRLGNMANSEIYGQIGNSPFETVFVENVEDLLESRMARYVSEVEMNPAGRMVETDSINYPVYTLTITPQQHISGRAMADSITYMPAILSRTYIDRVNALPMEGSQLRYNEANNTVEYDVLGVPRLPTQLFEAGGYLLVFIILFTLFRKDTFRYRNGFMFGAFLVLVFGFRFVIEHWKANQVAFEMGMSLNRGQQLSIPLVAIGIYYLLGKKIIKPNTLKS